MGYDRKYGKVTTEHGTIGEDEPVVVLRARDKLVPDVLEHYLRLCIIAGCPRRHIAIVRKTIDTVRHWQFEHKELVRRPASAGSADRLPE